MNAPLRLSTCLLTLIACVAASAQQPTPAQEYRVVRTTTTAPAQTVEVRNGTLTLSGPTENSITYDVGIALTKAAPAVNSTYMGVGVEPPGEALRAQLKLDAGTGLVVNYVDPDGPSKSAIHAHDVLLKLDDQLLINGEQLVALVRLRKPGQSIRFSLIRQAKPASADVVLGEKKVALDVNYQPQYADGPASTATFTRSVPVLGEIPLLGRLYQNLEAPRAPATQPAAVVLPNPPINQTTLTADRLTIDGGALNFSGNVIALATRTSPVTIDDGEVLMWLQPGKQGAELTVVDRASGQNIFHGPIGTSEEWERVPAPIRSKFDRWRSALSQPTPEKK